MKKLLLIVMLIGGSYLLAEDGSSLASPKPKTPEYLCQHWVHSFEEQQQADKDSIYRPKDFKKFPGSRFRMQYIFYKNGDCEWYYLSTDDAHHFQPGKWRFDPRKSILQIIKGDTTESYRVTELTKDMLRITPIEPRGEKS